MKTAAETRLSLNSVRKHKMLIAVCFITLNVIMVSDSSPSNQVKQIPAQMFYKPQETAKITCSHSIQDYNVILWYKTSANRQLQLLGYMFGDSLSLSDQVHQSPADMFKQPGEEAKINCFHTSSTFDQILWYKQTNIQLQLLGYMYVSPTIEDGAGVRIEGSAKKGENCTLTIEGLKLSSSAVYFCAARLHSVCLGVEVHQTPPALIGRPGDKVQLVCSHKKTDFYLMQWYQKSPGDRALKRIGHVLHNNREYEESFREDFNITGDMSGTTAKNGSLFIYNLKAPEHSAVYYCAASDAQ
ncbi:uncharacterized protein LOC119004910 [Acanthopagrus latus]|uniref:uncharacterized protein LOC119004910 n=1 Tax=Acanthopagrus latus TaxID=8177 RepID=UPI00187C9EF1|nr:uncharacterized protein LOC119004910 [Acanthopagrus latus]